MRLLHWVILIALDIIFIIMVIILGIPFTEDTMQIVLFVVSLNVGFIGILLGLEARMISQNRHVAVNKYERPHVIRTMETLIIDMSKTISDIMQYNQTNETDSTKIVEYVHARVQWHMETIRLLTLQFLDTGLSEHHTLLELALVKLGTMRFSRQPFDMDELVTEFDSIIDSVFQVKKDIMEAPAL